MDDHSLLLERWRNRADDHRRYAPPVAAALDDVVSELVEDDHRIATAALTLAQASAESGYSAGHIGRLIAEGRIANAGKKGAPRIRRGDLPRKPKPAEPPPQCENGDGPDLAGEVLRRRGLIEEL